MGLEREVDKILGLDASASRTKDKRRVKIKALKENILNGGTTGDKIRDFVIVSYEDISPEAEDPYRKLEEMLKGKEKEQVLVVNENIESSGGSGCFGGSGYTNVDSTLRLGILTSGVEFEIGDGKMDFSLLSVNASPHGPRIILPTEKYVVKREGGLSPKAWELVEGNIQISSSEFHYFNPEGKKTESRGLLIKGGPGSGSSRHYSKLLIKVGEDVPKYFRENGLWGRIDTSYVKALKSLGIEDQAPNDFLIGHNQEIGEAKIGILDKLNELSERKEELSTSIDKIYVRVGGNYEDERSDGMVFVREFTEDDANAFSSGERRELKEVRKNIISVLERSVEMSMHQHDWILDGKRPGETLNVPEYISSMCGKYEVPYSKN